MTPTVVRSGKQDDPTIVKESAIVSSTDQASIAETQPKEPASGTETPITTDQDNETKDKTVRLLASTGASVFAFTGFDVLIATLGVLFAMRRRK